MGAAQRIFLGNARQRKWLTGKARQQDIMLRNMLANVFRRLIIADPFPVAQCDIADIFIKAMLQRIAKNSSLYMSVPRAYSIRW